MVLDGMTDAQQNLRHAGDPTTSEVTRTMSRDHIRAEDQQAGEALACRVFPRCDLQVDVIGPLQWRMT